MNCPSVFQTNEFMLKNKPIKRKNPEADKHKSDQRIEMFLSQSTYSSFPYYTS